MKRPELSGKDKFLTFHIKKICVPLSPVTNQYQVTAEWFPRETGHISKHVFDKVFFHLVVTLMVYLLNVTEANWSLIY